jgi:hypothetical protein
MTARRTPLRLVLVAAMLLVANVAGAQSRHATMMVGVTVVRSCSVAAPDRIGETAALESPDRLVVRCGRGAADAVTVDFGGDDRPIVQRVALDGPQASLPTVAVTLPSVSAPSSPVTLSPASGPYVPEQPGTAHDESRSERAPRSLMLTVNF